MAKTGLSKSTRGQKLAAAQKAADFSRADQNEVTGRLKSFSRIPESSSVIVILSDGNESVTANGRTDDGSDESIVSTKLVEPAVRSGIGKMKKIDTLSLQVAPKDGGDAKEFTFSSTRNSPRTTLELAAGPLALINITFLVADVNLAVEDFLIGLSILQHLGVDTKTLLKIRRDLLNGADCSFVRAVNESKHGGMVSRLTPAHFNCVPSEGFAESSQDGLSRPRVNYYAVREEKDEFAETSLLDRIDSAHQNAIETAVENMIHKAFSSGFPTVKRAFVEKVVAEHKEIVHTSFLSGPPAHIEPLKSNWLQMLARKE